MQILAMNNVNRNGIRSASTTMSFGLRRVGRRSSRVGWGLLALGVWAGAIQAQNIPVPNGSFESPTPPPGFPATPLIDSWQKAPQPAWYDPDAFGGITWDQTTGVFPNTAEGSPDHIVNLDGSQAAYLFALPEVALFQELETAYEVGLSYTLTVGMLGSQGIAEGSAFELSLYYLDEANAPVTLASTPVTYTTAVFPNAIELVDFSVNLSEVQAADAWAGQSIGIQFLSTFGQGGVWDLDHVRLQAIPEPGTMGLLAMGLSALAMVRQRASRRRTAGRGQST
jgi:hypothetical protein